MLILYSTFLLLTLILLSYNIIVILLL